MEKIEDFGVHCNEYYPLEIEVFKSPFDAKLLALMFNEYWKDTLASSTAISVCCTRYRTLK